MGLSEGNEDMGTDSTQEAMVYAVDENGFVNLDHRERDWFFLEEMRKQLSALEAGIERCEAEFRKEMLAAIDQGNDVIGFTVGGVRRVTFKQDGTFPVKRFREANPHIYNAYQMPSTTFDREAFKRDHPELYKQFTPRSFKFV